MKHLALLGSTGSIGRNTLEVVAAHPDRFRVIGLAAGSNIELLLGQIACYKPEIVSVAAESDMIRVRESFPGVKVHCGQEGLCRVAAASDIDTVVAASNGTVALEAALTTLSLGRRLCLANKEVLVAAGELVMAQAACCGSEIIPVDSELSAIFQAMGASDRSFLKRIILTASGGPFYKTNPGKMAEISVSQALAHPVWAMGKKISIDSATMMNKALEMIEAFHLFKLRPEQVAVLIHPQGIVHSLVEYIDNSVLAQLSPPDMRLPIQYALSYPERRSSVFPALDLADYGKLEFFEPDRNNFPALALGEKVLEAGADSGAVLNAANETAVEYFLAGRIPFPAIWESVARVLENTRRRPLPDIKSVRETMAEAGALTVEILEKEYK